ncbi:patatin-like protein [Angustibacter sp. McL0619]|uniref:patatin-like protein n=1 Tax=Angustibacter sp. McL0619 TaxID=3415676 RepID=UPI003CED2C1E
MAESDTAATSRTVTELRLALVCYGGVSLAIYMHGVAKELHKLVVASRRFDELGAEGVNPFDERVDSEHAYFEALRDLSGDGRVMSVNVDIIAGTSAGGINGVCLAKVLARNGSQDALKRLWIDEGDLKKLLKAPPVLGWRTRAALAVGGLLPRLRKPVSPLRGDRMSRLLYDAIAAMEDPVDADRRTLLQPTTPLDLFVTTTDLAGFRTLVPTGAGGASQRETDHSQVVQLRTDGQDDTFGADSVGTLAFAARATSSFPGAFPPVSLNSFKAELDGRPLDGEQVALRFRRRYADPAQSLDAWFVDGGVLDNAPFDLVVEAISQKRAETEVVRRLVYIQPDPGRAIDTSVPGPLASEPAPGYLSGLLKSVGSVRGSHSILRELENLRDLNGRIAELSAIAEQQGTQVDTALEAAWVKAAPRQAGQAGQAGHAGQAGQPWDINDQQDVQALAASLYDEARTFVGAGFATYCRLKVEVAGARLADEVVLRFVYPPGSSRASFVRAAISAWARGHVEWREVDQSRLLELLGPVDVPYRERRLMFILSGINALYATTDTPTGPPRAQLDALKTRAWQLLEQLRAAPRQAVDAVPDSAVTFLGADLTDEHVFSNPELFAADHDAEFTTLFSTYRASLEEQLKDSTVPIWQGFVQHTAEWSQQDRQGLLSRYLGFPLWDALIFPTVALAQLPQFSPITVSQFSPLAAMALPTPEGGKLKGVSLHHFGGFADAAWRENDYLWGRLDAAELLLRTLRSSTPGQSPPTPRDSADAARLAGPRLRPALSAILAAEHDLVRDPAMLPSLRAAVQTLPPS